MYHRIDETDQRVGLGNSIEGMKDIVGSRDLNRGK